MDERNYVLIGFMGAGKTTVGKSLAKRLGADFQDTDAWIERDTGLTVSDIFQQFGEEHFRMLETALVKKLSSSLQNTVLSVGGGLPIKKENHSYLKNIGTVVYLEVSKETVLKRLSKDTTRPLLAGEPSEAEDRIRRLLQERGPVYAALADRVIAADAFSVEEIVEQIISIYR